jgi:hypothetical protein
MMEREARDALKLWKVYPFRAASQECRFTSLGMPLDLASKTDLALVFGRILP